MALQYLTFRMIELGEAVKMKGLGCVLFSHQVPQLAMLNAVCIGALSKGNAARLHSIFSISTDPPILYLRTLVCT